MPLSRRQLMRRMGMLLAAGMPLPALVACAMSPPLQGVRQFRGDVSIDHAPVRPDQPLPPHGVIRTGADSHAVLVVGADAFLIRAQSEVVFEGVHVAGTLPQLAQAAPQEKASDGGSVRVELPPAGVKGFLLKAGAILSVFGPGPERRVHTPIAVAGIRGTGIYMEHDPYLSYVCSCYGTTTLTSVGQTEPAQVVRTRHHESPFRFIQEGKSVRIEPAPMIHHADAELIMLEGLLDRRPAFYDPLNPSGSQY